MGDKRNLKYNQSGCADLTAYEALKPIIADKLYQYIMQERQKCREEEKL